MPANTVTDLVVNQYIRQPVPLNKDGMDVYLSGQLQEIENSMKTVGEGSLQVVDTPPARPLKGMLRYAVTPWDPLGNGFQGLVVYSGGAWLRASDPENVQATLETSIAAATSAVTSLTSTVTTQGNTITAQASNITSLTSTVGSNTTNVTTNASSINGIQGKHTVKIDNNGHVSGYGLISTANNGTPTATFSVAADAFKIGSPSSASTVTPFSVYTGSRTVDGVTVPAGTYIENAFITAANIKTLNADSITTGTINAGNINVSNLNATNVTQGTLSATRLPGLSQIAHITSSSPVSLTTNNAETTFQLTTGSLTAGSKLLVLAKFRFNGTSASNAAYGTAYFESTGLLTDSSNTWNRSFSEYSGINSDAGFVFNGFAAAVKSGSDGAVNIKIRIKNTGTNNRTIQVDSGVEILVLAVEK